MKKVKDKSEVKKQLLSFTFYLAIIPGLVYLQVLIDMSDFRASFLSGKILVG